MKRPCGLRLALARTTHEFPNAVTQFPTLTALRCPARLVSAAFASLRYSNLRIIQIPSLPLCADKACGVWKASWEALILSPTEFLDGRLSDIHMGQGFFK